MAKYLVKELSFINNSLVPAGEVIDYDPPEGTTISSNLEAVKKGRAARDAAPEPGPERGSEFGSEPGSSTEVQP